VTCRRKASGIPQWQIIAHESQSARELRRLLLP
jgi:hypothetical protein